MYTVQKLRGINNILEPNQLAKGELVSALNVDLDTAGAASRRAGLTAVDKTAPYRWLHEGASMTLAVKGVAGDLVDLTDGGTVVRAAVGHAQRMWYVDLPDGRVAYSNGVVTGVAIAPGGDLEWGPPVPVSAGAATDVAGALHPGDYQWSITYRRTLDGLEGGPAYCAAPLTVALGGVSLTGLPTRAGYTINVYLTSHFGGERYLAGNTAGSTFAFTGENKDLVRPCPTEFLRPAPAGRLLAYWRGRVLVAVGNVLYASLPHRWEHFNLRKDFKHFPDEITLLQPVLGGVWVGTAGELGFMQGDKFDDLKYTKVAGPVILGSGTRVDGKLLQRGKEVGEGDCMVCIAGRRLVGGFADGTVVTYGEDRYAVDEAVTEVVSTFIADEDTPRYVAVPQEA